MSLEWAKGRVGMIRVESLCESCARMREVLTPRGSRFLLCQLSRSDRRFPKYPPQPVVRCGGYEPRPQGERTAGQGSGEESPE